MKKDQKKEKEKKRRGFLETMKRRSRQIRLIRQAFRSSIRILNALDHQTIYRK